MRIEDCGVLASADEQAAQERARAAVELKRAEDVKKAAEREAKLVKGEDSDDDDGEEMSMVRVPAPPPACAQRCSPLTAPYLPSCADASSWSGDDR